MQQNPGAIEDRQEAVRFFVREPGDDLRDERVEGRRVAALSPDKRTRAVECCIDRALRDSGSQEIGKRADPGVTRQPMDGWNGAEVVLQSRPTRLPSDAC